MRNIQEVLEAHIKLLEEEGFIVRGKGRNLFVDDYEKYLFAPKNLHGDPWAGWDLI